MRAPALRQHRLQSLTHHGGCAGTPSRLNPGRITLWPADSPLFTEPLRLHLYPSEERETWIKKKNATSLCMVYGANYFKKTDHGSWHSPWPRNSSIRQERELQGRHVRQDTTLIYASKGTSLQPRTQKTAAQHGERDEGGSKVWRNFSTSKDLCTAGLLSLEKTELKRICYKVLHGPQKADRDWPLWPFPVQKLGPIPMHAGPPVVEDRARNSLPKDAVVHEYLCRCKMRPDMLVGKNIIWINNDRHKLFRENMGLTCVSRERQGDTQITLPRRTSLLGERLRGGNQGGAKQRTLTSSYCSLRAPLDTQ